MTARNHGLCDSVSKTSRGTSRSAELNRKYQEKYPYLEFFAVNNFCRKLFFRQHKIVFINDNDNDNECFILTYELIKQIIYSTMIDQYSHSQGNYIMTYISLACNYRKMF